MKHKIKGLIFNGYGKQFCSHPKNRKKLNSFTEIDSSQCLKGEVLKLRIKTKTRQKKKFNSERLEKAPKIFQPQACKINQIESISLNRPFTTHFSTPTPIVHLLENLVGKFHYYPRRVSIRSCFFFIFEFYDGPVVSAPTPRLFLWLSLETFHQEMEFQ